MLSLFVFVVFFFFKQKTAYEMRISDWSSDVCSSDLAADMLREVARKGEYLAHKALQLRDPGVAGVEPRFGIAAFLHVVAMAAPARARKARGHIIRKAQRLADLAKDAAGAITEEGGGHARGVSAIAGTDK